MPHRFPALQILDAGVYFRPVLSPSGRPLLMAVDEHGRVVREVEVGPSDDAALLTRQLQAELRRQVAA